MLCISNPDQLKNTINSNTFYIWRDYVPLNSKLHNIITVLITSTQMETRPKIKLTTSSLDND